MNGRLLAMCPTRKRPEHLKRMIESMRETSALCDLALYVDDDDDTDYSWVDYPIIRGPRIGVAKSTNRICEAHPGYDAYGFMVDDGIFEYNGWESWVLSESRAFKGGVGAICPQTINGHQRRMDFPWMTGKWVQAAGSFIPYDVEHFYWDIALQIVAEQLDSIAFSERGQFQIGHVGIMPEIEPPADKPTDYGIRIVNTHADARWTCLWLAVERHKFVDKLRRAQEAQ